MNPNLEQPKIPTQQELRETSFNNHFDYINEQTHYTVWDELAGKQYENKYSTDLTAFLTAITVNNKEKIENLENPHGLISALRLAGIKNVAEVGPGSQFNESLILPVRHPFQSAGCKLLVITDDFGEESKSKFKDQGIEVVDKEAGNLGNENLNLDLVFAHNVFSLGGHYTAGRYDTDPINIIKLITNSVIDLIKQLSDNPNASIILTETYDFMPLDRGLIEKEAVVLSWIDSTNMNASICRSAVENESDYVVDIYNRAPRLVVLQKKLNN